MANADFRISSNLDAGEEVKTGRPLLRRAVAFFGMAPSPLRPVLFFAPIDVCILYYCYAQGIPLTTITVAFSSGFLIWTLAEYLLHRFLFHSSPHSPRMRRLIDYLHIHHHKEPLVPPSNVVPIWTMIVLSIAGILLLWPVLQSFYTALLTFTGFGVGYLCYESSHYIMHLALLREKVWPAWAACHLDHHFANARMNFGVSSSFWDRVFFTYSRPEKHATVEPIRS